MSYTITSDISPDATVVARIHGGSQDGMYVVVRPEGMGRKEFALKNGTLVPILSKNGCNCVHMAAPRKSGKTTLLSKIINESDKDIYLFTRLAEGEDASLDIDPDRIERIDINSLVDTPLDWRELTGRVIIFDDAETSTNPAVNKAVRILADQILESGRRHIPASIRTAHFLLNSVNSRQALLECDLIIVFHRSGLAGQCLRYFKDRCGLSKAQIERVMGIKGRWIACFRLAPNCYFGENEFIIF